MGNEDLRGSSSETHSPFSEGQQSTNRFVQGISSYLQDAQRTEILRPHQREVFDKFQRFFQEVATRGYIELPTGTGKTVLFVELSKALLGTDPSLPRPKILVVTPTKDLVHQTMGRTGKKGYGRFAPDLRVGSYFSDTPDRERTCAALDSYDVVVTTYRSFFILSHTDECRPITDTDRQVLMGNRYYTELADRMGLDEAISLLSTIKNVSTGRKLLSKFDIFILDEAHHIFGGESGKIIESLPEDKVIIGFTATPDAGQQRRLTHYLLKKIYSLELNEAIWLGLSAPVVPLGIKSGIHIRGSNLYDESGDFIDRKIRYLAEDTGRNRLIVEVAKSLKQNGLGTIISCIAGDEAWHARYLAEQLQTEGINAIAVHSGVPSETRQEIYQQFEKGGIDTLTFIGVLGEGWDSDRAKAIIGARPTRSIIFSKQRLGRITRPSGIAFAIDILDEYEDRNPAITVADVLNEGDKPAGSIVGTAEDTSIVQTVVSSLRSNLPVVPVLESRYRSYEELLSGLEELNRGVILSKDKKRVTEWALATRVSPAYTVVTDEIFEKIEELRGISINKKPARQGNSIRTVYNVKEAGNLLYKLPEVDPRKYFTDAKGIKRISPEGLVLLFSKRFPDLTLQVLKEQLEQIEGQMDWIPARYRYSPEDGSHRQHIIIKMYNAGQQTVDLLYQALSQIFQHS